MACNASSVIYQLNPVTFKWVSAPEVGTVTGFLAHEVQTHIPEAVTGVKDAMNGEKIVPQQLDTSKIIPYLVKSLQEALTRIEALEGRIT
jgi:hypothetical protein